MGKLTEGEIVHLLIQLGVMLIMGRVLAEIARHLKQPAVVGEILAGIFLGPTVLGMIRPDWFAALYPTGTATGIVLAGFVQLAVVMLLFVAGFEVDLTIVWKQGRQAISTSLLGLIVPFLLGFIFPYLFPEFFGHVPGETSKLIYSLFMGTAMAITALPVIVRILMDINLFKSKMGQLVVASAMVDDVIGWLTFSVILGLIGKSGSMSVLTTALLTVGYAVIMLTVGKAALNKVLPWVNSKVVWPGGILSLSLAMCFLGAAFTEYIGIHAIFGAFIMGIALGDSSHFSERAKEIVHQFIYHVFAPLFFVSIGLRVNFVTNFDWQLTLAILAIAFAGKIIGSGVGTRLGGFGWRESLAAGFGMNARGAMEIILGLIALQNGLINERVFVSLVIMALVTSMVSGPMMRKAMGAINN
jgi:Kef-type K+ transport system membrane component KefB